MKKIKFLLAVTLVINFALSIGLYAQDYQHIIAIKGHIITMDSNIPDAGIPDGYVVFSTDTKHSKILKIFKSDSEYNNSAIKEKVAFMIDTEDSYIYPGFIDLHNHVPYNCNRLVKFHDKPEARYTWQRFSEYVIWFKSYLANINNMEHRKYINHYSELKALVGGTTILQGEEINGATESQLATLDTIFSFLVTNLESKDYREDIYSNVFIYEKYKTDDGINYPVLKDVEQKLQTPSYKAYIFHIAEGYDERSRQELPNFHKCNGLSHKSILLHGVGFSEDQIDLVAQEKATMVWSPTSNLVLYGKTANVKYAKDQNVNLCLGTDWSPSSPKNLLHEIKMASLYSEDKKLGFTHKDLVEMITINPAKAMDYDKILGQITEGYEANMVVFTKGRSGDPYTTVINSVEENLKLSIINGVPKYGDAKLIDVICQEASRKGIESLNCNNYQNINIVESEDFDKKVYTADRYGENHFKMDSLKTAIQGMFDEEKLEGIPTNKFYNTIQLVRDPIFPDCVYFNDILMLTGYNLEQFWEGQTQFEAKASK